MTHVLPQPGDLLPAPRRWWVPAKAPIIKRLSRDPILIDITIPYHLLTQLLILTLRTLKSRVRFIILLLPFSPTVLTITAKLPCFFTLK